MKKLIAFGYYGGKYSHLSWLLPLLPETGCYCEPFGGSGAVLLNREPSAIETYNDLDGDLCNFFRVLRSNKDDLLEQIAFTPFSRLELEKACSNETVSDLERARRLFVRMRQTRFALGQIATVGKWANCVAFQNSNSGMSGSVSRWLGSNRSLALVSERLLRVQIENLDYSEVIKRYDTSETLFYCDPPYLHSTRVSKRVYKFEMTDEQHSLFAQQVNKVRGLVAISLYDSPLITHLYPENKWRIEKESPKKAHTSKDIRQEILIMNYDPQGRKILWRND